MAYRNQGTMSPGGKGRGEGSYGDLAETPTGSKSSGGSEFPKKGTFKDDADGNPVGHHGKHGHVGHEKGHRMSHGGCKSCQGSPCTCPP